MYYIYKFLDYQNNIIYIGKSKNIKRRMKEHFGPYGHLPQECYDFVARIFYTEIPSQTETEMYETLFINEEHPIYNEEKNYNEILLYKDRYLNEKKLIWHELWIDFTNGIEPRISSKPNYDFYQIYDMEDERKMAFLNFNKTQLLYRSGLFYHGYKEYISEIMLNSMYQLLNEIENKKEKTPCDFDEPILFRYVLDNYITFEKEILKKDCYHEFVGIWKHLGWMEPYDDKLMKLGCFREEGILNFQDEKVLEI